jgi:GR25 family glycosyltransferase involved in LPS biosynthesis
MIKRYTRILILFLIVLIVGLFACKKKQVDMMSEREGLDNVDVIYYINLDHRTDRKQEFLQEMHKAGIPESKIVRVSAVKMDGRGDLGCSRSHIKAMDLFIASNYDNCIVFEDDFHWMPNADPVSAMKEFFNYRMDYDVLMLSANEVRTDKTDRSILRRVINVQTASGYMVHKDFAPTLLENFVEGANLLEQGYNEGKPDAAQYAVDQYWKKLQPDNEWFMIYPKLGKQRASMSDIVGGKVDYGV